MNKNQRVGIEVKVISYNGGIGKIFEAIKWQERGASPKIEAVRERSRALKNTKIK